MVSCCLRFDISFMAIVIFEYFNFGMFFIALLSAQDYCKAYLECEPAQMSFYTSMIGLPWSLKVLWGLMTDNLPICGLKRKPYLVFFALLQGSLMLGLYFLEVDSGAQLCVFLVFVSLSTAFSNVVIDAVLVI